MSELCVHVTAGTLQHTPCLSHRSLYTQLAAADERESTLRDQCKQKQTECASITEELKR